MAYIRWVCAAEQVVVFRVTILRLEQGVFLGCKPCKECEGWRHVAYMSGTNKYLKKKKLIPCC